MCVRRPVDHQSFHRIIVERMATIRDSPMDGQVSQADLILNRTNMALARSQKLIQSWLPPRPEQESEQDAGAQDDGEDLKSMLESAGVGAARQYDEGLPDPAFQRKKLSSNDKLLEQLLGKKAAKAHKASRPAPAKSMSQAKHTAPKPLAPRPKQEEAESEDDEGGRSTVFQSRSGKSNKRQGAKKGPTAPGQSQMYEQIEAEAGSTLDENRGVPDPVRKLEKTSTLDSEPDERPKRRKGGSYLDELLAEKARKKSKKKKP